MLLLLNKIQQDEEFLCAKKVGNKMCTLVLECKINK